MHKGWTKFLKRYPTASAWIAQNPGIMAGRLIGKAPPVTYYCQYSEFLWVLGRDPLAKIGSGEVRFFDSYAEWQAARVAAGYI